MTKKICLLIMLGNLIIQFVHAQPNPNQDERVKKVYEHLQGQLIWVKNGTWTPCAKTLLGILSHVDKEGLWQENYTPILESLQKTDIGSQDGQKKADELLTLGALNYISDMKGTRLNLHAAVKDIYLNQKATDEVEELKNYLSLSSQCSWIHGLSPTTPEYQHLKLLLSSYRDKQTQGGWPRLPKGTKLQKGEQGPLVETLRAQLMAQDALPSQGQTSDVFDDSLEQTVKIYQELHGLEKDGKVGGATLAALNTPIEDRIRSIIVNLERQRWYPLPLPARYLQVNIPGFYLKAVNGGTPAFFMPIITGKEHTKTPVFNAPMTEIIFNPSWHVPASIARELLPKIQSNPGAYAAKGYHIDESSGRITQNPGKANSLGKIRFTLDDPFSIYLHGTPNEKLFLKANRALSHGCIRVQDPVKLAAFVFDNQEKWPSARIHKEASGTTTKPVKLDQSLPVFVTYFTIFEDENHKIHFVADEYGQDKAVWKALEELKKSRRGFAI
jgi:murein L,D-transpeptidase YcbB/YkuD